MIILISNTYSFLGSIAKFRGRGKVGRGRSCLPKNSWPVLLLLRHVRHLSYNHLRTTKF